MRSKSTAAAAESQPVPDLDETRRFLDVLAPGEQVTFQTFSDRKPAGRDVLAKVMAGTIDGWGAKLAMLNAQGAGVFVAVNAIEGDRRTAENVTHVRAVFVDLDGAPLVPVLALPEHLQPHVIVESSPGRWHAYWLVEGCARDRFSDLQRSLAARFGGDPKVCDLSRVMRLPGFVHCKGEPFLTRIERQRDGAPFSVDELVAGLGLHVDGPRASADVVPLRPAGERRRDFETQLAHGYLRAALSYVDPEPYDNWNAMGRALYHASEGGDDAKELWASWAAAGEKFDPSETDRRWASFGRTTREQVNTLGTLFAEAKAAGWDDTARCKDDPLPPPVRVERAGRPPRLPEPFPGLVADMHDWVLANARRPQPEFALLSVLAAFGALAGRVYHWPDGLRMNLYAMLIGPTASGKDWPLSAADEGVGISSRVMPTGLPASGPGLQDAVADHAELFIKVDEVAHGLMRSNGKNPDGNSITLMRELLTLFSASQTRYALRASARAKLRPPVAHPAVSFIGAGTPQKLGEALGHGDLVSGLLNRFLIANVDGEVMPELREVAHTPMPAALRARLDEIGRAGDKLAGGRSEFICLRIEPQAATFLQDLTKRMDRVVQESTAPYVAELRGRAAEKTKKVAGIAAVAANPTDPVVTLAMVIWAEKVVLASDAQLLALAQDRIATDEADAAAKRVMRAVRSVLDGGRRHRNEQGRRLAAAGYASRREVLRASGISELRVFDAAVNLLVERGDLCVGVPDKARVELVPGTAAPRVIWIPEEV